MINQNFVFIGGCPRSGTTLLQLMLSNHAQICLCPETNLFPKIVKKYPRQKLLTESELADLQKVITTDEKLKQWKIKLDDYYKQVESYQDCNVRQALLDLMIYYRDQVNPNATVIGNKKCTFIEYRAALQQVFPEGKMLTIIRDPRAVVASLKKNMNWSVPYAAMVWQQRIRQGFIFAKKNPNQVLELKYEDLVTKPDEQLVRICKFIGVSFAEEMLKYHEQNQALEQVMSGDEEVLANTAKPLLAERLTAWQTELSNQEIAITEYLCKSGMLLYEYETDVSSKKISLSNKIALKKAQVIHNLKGWWAYKKII